MRMPGEGPLIGRAITMLLRPLVLLYGWWVGFRLWTGTVYVVAPDTIAIFFMVVAPLYVVPVLLFSVWQAVLLGLLVAPLAFLSVLRIRNGRVVRVRFLLCIPYWVTFILPRSTFDLEESWDDPGPTGVVFRYGEDEVSFGSSRSAHALCSAISSVLEEQKWRMGPLTSSSTPVPERKEPTL